jgi:hypothetical protein
MSYIAGTGLIAGQRKQVITLNVDKLTLDIIAKNALDSSNYTQTENETQNILTNAIDTEINKEGDGILINISTLQNLLNNKTDGIIPRVVDVENSLNHQTTGLIFRVIQLEEEIDDEETGLISTRAIADANYSSINSVNVVSPGILVRLTLAEQAGVTQQAELVIINTFLFSPINPLVINLASVLALQTTGILATVAGLVILKDIANALKYETIDNVNLIRNYLNNPASSATELIDNLQNILSVRRTYNEDTYFKISNTPILQGYVTASQTAQTGSETSATASATSATASATSATASATSATASSTSKTASATSATASATSATASSTSKTASATSATASATSATNSSASATASATSKTGADTSKTECQRIENILSTYSGNIDTFNTAIGIEIEGIKTVNNNQTTAINTKQRVLIANSPLQLDKSPNTNDIIKINENETLRINNIITNQNTGIINDIYFPFLTNINEENNSGNIENTQAQIDFINQNKIKTNNSHDKKYHINWAYDNNDCIKFTLKNNPIKDIIQISYHQNISSAIYNNTILTPNQRYDAYILNWGNKLKIIQKYSPNDTFYWFEIRFTFEPIINSAPVSKSYVFITNQILMTNDETKYKHFMVEIDGINDVNVYINFYIDKVKYQLYEYQGGPQILELAIKPNPSDDVFIGTLIQSSSIAIGGNCYKVGSDWNMENFTHCRFCMSDFQINYITKSTVLQLYDNSKVGNPSVILAINSEFGAIKCKSLHCENIFYNENITKLNNSIFNFKNDNINVLDEISINSGIEIANSTRRTEQQTELTRERRAIYIDGENLNSTRNLYNESGNKGFLFYGDVNFNTKAQVKLIDYTNDILNKPTVLTVGNNLSLSAGNLLNVDISSKQNNFTLGTNLSFVGTVLNVNLTSKQNAFGLGTNLSFVSNNLQVNLTSKQNNITAGTFLAFTGATLNADLSSKQNVFTLGTNLSFTNTVLNVDLSSKQNTLILNGNDLKFNATTSELELTKPETWTKTLNNISFSTGNIGIGTASPQTLLHLYGDLNPALLIEDGPLSGANQASIRFKTSITDWVLGQHGEGTIGNFKICNDTSFGSSSKLILIKSSGYCGLNTDNPQHQLHVGGNVNISSGFKYKINGENLAYSDLENLPNLALKQDVITFDYPLLNANNRISMTDRTNFDNDIIATIGAIKTYNADKIVLKYVYSASSYSLTFPYDVECDILVIAGGGGGAGRFGGGGGAGGLTYAQNILINAGTYAIVVGNGGNGGAGSSATGNFGLRGTDSSIFSYVTTGGGGGRGYNNANTSTKDGGSGGGATFGYTTDEGLGIVGQGFNGGEGIIGGDNPYNGGGGGGAGAVGQTATTSKNGDGGVGREINITGTSIFYAGGGGGGSHVGVGSIGRGLGGNGGGGDGGVPNTSSAGTAGTNDFGGGGGSASLYSSAGPAGGKGGSGIIIISYKKKPFINVFMNPVLLGKLTPLSDVKALEVEGTISATQYQVGGVALSYTHLTNLPTLITSYTALSDLPTLITSYTALSDLPTLITSYNSLTDKPNLDLKQNVITLGTNLSFDATIPTKINVLDMRFLGSYIGSVNINVIPSHTNSYNHSKAGLTISYNTIPSSDTVLNDPQDVLHLTREGTNNKAYGNRATFKLCRWANSSTDSKTQLNIVLATGTYLDKTVMTIRDNGQISLPTGGQYMINNIALAYTDLINLPNLALKQDVITCDVPLKKTVNAISLKYNASHFTVNDVFELALSSAIVSQTTTPWTIQGNDIFYNTGGVGIGRLPSTTYKLNVYNSATYLGNSSLVNGTDDNVKLILNTASSQVTSWTSAGRIVWVGHNRNISTNTSSFIDCINVNGDYEDQGNLAFGTSDGGGAAVEKMRISKSGNVTIGKRLSETPYKLKVEGGNSGFFSDNEAADLVIALGTPNTHTNAVYKCAIIMDAVSNWSRAHMNFCINDVADNNSATLAHARMTITKEGRVGIANTNPSYVLDVGNGVCRLDNAIVGRMAGSTTYAQFANSSINDNGANYCCLQQDTGASFVNASEGQELNLRIGNNNKVRVVNNNSISGSSRYLSLAGEGTTSTTLSGISLKVFGSCHVDGIFITTSDIRIKKNIMPLDEAECLLKINQLNPCKYNYIDTAGKGNKNVIGFIAQEVRDVFPEATISNNTDYIPCHYEKCQVLNDNIKTTKEHDFIIGDKLKFFGVDDNQYFYEVVNVIDEYNFTINETLEVTELFIYGKEINDLCVLDKQAIFTVGISSIQQLSRICDRQQIMIDSQQTIIDDLLSRVLALEG